MVICPKCRMEMQCVMNGVRAKYGCGHIYSGDKYRCKKCGGETVVTSAVPYFDATSCSKEPTDRVLIMEEGEANEKANV